MADLIDRQIAIKKAEAMLDSIADEKESISKSARLSLIKWLMHELEDIPSARREATVWITYYFGDNPIGYQCLACRHPSADKTPFCPYCGLEMANGN